MLGVLGASENAERVYYVSHDVLTSAENSYGAKAREGEDNLYLSEPDPNIPASD